jgi:hypothetical protein
VNEFLATFNASLQMELHAVDTQGLGEEGYTGSIGCPFHWRGCQAQTYIPVTQAIQAFDTCPRLHPQA